MKSFSKLLAATAVSALVTLACVEQGGTRPDLIPAGSASAANDLLIVDCLLPSQVRRLGSRVTYLAARRAIQTSAQDCEIRGGEYVAYDRANYSSALNVWLPLAQQGDADAQNKVGEIYEKGLGVAPDYESAALWYKRAAEQGFNRAQINLAFLYEKGRGVNIDLNRALELYRQASQLPEAIVIDRSELEQSRRETEALRRDLQAKGSELDSSRREQESLRRNLQAKGSELESSRQKQEALRRSLQARSSELSRARQEFNQKESTLQRDRERLRQELEQRPTSGLSPAEQQKVEQMRADVERQNRELTQKQEQIRQLEEQSKHQGAKLESLQSEGTSIKEHLAQAQAQLERTKQELTRTQQLSTKSDTELQQLRAELQRAQSQPPSTQRIAELEAQTKRQEQALAEQRQTAEQLRQKTARLEAQVGAAEAAKQPQVTELQGQLTQAKAEMQRLQTQMTAKVTELEQTRAQAAAKPTPDPAQAQRIQQLEARLAEREKALADNEHKVAQLREESSQWQTRLNELQKQTKAPETSRAAGADIPLAPPSIQLIDPPLVVVRGESSIPVKANEGTRTIIGQVASPAGLFALTINGATALADDKGLFQTDIRLAGETTPVNILAVDKQGRQASLAFKLVSEKGATKVVAKETDSLEGVEVGKYYALVIGNQNYPSLPRLETAKYDAQVIGRLLEKKFGFKTSLLLDANRYQILSELNRLRKELTENDNLLIFYAGHGELDRANLRGHWLPLDAEADSTANWISTVAITDVLNAMSARHVLVISDSCYSGALTRSSLANLEAGQSRETRTHWLKTIAKMRSRTVLTSGGLAPVLDGGGGAHSVFAKALIGVLEDIGDVAEGQRIFREVAARVAFDANKYQVEQVPEYAPIKFAGHESGDFLFVPRRQPL